MGWELVTAMLVEVARGRARYGGFRSWFGRMPIGPEGREPATVARMVGYSVEPDAFVELAFTEARDALSFFTIDTLVMPSGSVPPEALSDIFEAGIERLGTEARFFSNGRWHEYARSLQFEWCGLSDATFDGGLIGMNDEVAFIVWVEEED